MRRTIIAVLVTLLVPLAGGVAAAQSAGGGYQRVVDLTFPAAGNVRYSDDYHASRGGGSRVHQSTDILGTKLQTLHAAVDGVVCSINGIDEPMPSWGYSITLCGDDGLEYRYVHINNDHPGTDDGLGGPGWAYAPGIRKGLRVTRGQWVGYMGDSGNAEETSPHLHFEIRDSDMVDPALDLERYQQGRMNPYPSLQDARRRGDLPIAPAPTTPTPPPNSDPVPQPSPRPTPPPPTTSSGTPSGGRRLAGATRIETAVALSGELDRAAVAVIVPSGSHAEALVAAPLAGLLGAPVLLTGADGLHPGVAAEVRRLGVRNAYLVGRPDQLSAQVEADLDAAGVVARARLDAPDVGTLSAVVAREMASYPSLVGEIDRVFLALGTSPEASRAWPDALSASALAAELAAPVLLTGGDALPPAVAEILAELDPELVQVVGGIEAIPEAVSLTAESATPGARFERLAGATRYATSAAVASEARDEGLRGRSAWLATGLDFPDALAAGPAAARDGAPLLLVDGTTAGASTESEAWLSAHAADLDAAVVVGGTAAVSEEVAERSAALLR